jgi:hypothetical protein
MGVKISQRLREGEVMAKPKKNHHTFFVQIPDPIWDAMSAEAEAEDRTVTSVLLRILRREYPDAAAAFAEQTDGAASPARRKAKK